MTTPTRDARSLPAIAQEDLRRKVVNAVAEGMSQTEAARLFGVSRVAVNGWVRRAGDEGAPAGPAEGLAPGPASGGHGRAADRGAVSRPDEAAVRVVDACGGAVAAEAALRSGGVGVDGGPVSRALGTDAAEAVAAGVRAGPGGGRALVGAGVPGDPRACEGSMRPDPVGGRDGAAVR